MQTELVTLYFCIFGNMVPRSGISRSHTEALPGRGPEGRQHSPGSGPALLPHDPHPPRASQLQLRSPHVSVQAPHVPCSILIKSQSAQDWGPHMAGLSCPSSSQCPHLCLESGHTRPSDTACPHLTCVSDSRPLLRGPSRTTLPPARNKPYNPGGLPGLRRLPQQLSTGTRGLRTIHWVSSPTRGTGRQGGPESM